ncbi:N-acetyltransferase [Leptospira kobayashii]|uniref:N-acetyltransferase n=1 Tax=Leptospira kobayashii TaxID=1917830 RepID=A0ABM7UHJ8_9LEPT|nr:GNAT family N-acetyltransferase [Leptospira kobayashii]BDA78162.1 N-acetyltransferase [Leptospira kobayashii]
MTYDTRHATIEDLDQLTEIFDLYRIFYKQKSDLPAAKAFLFERFEHRESVILIVIDSEKDKIVGFTQLYPVFSSLSIERSLILNDLYVLEAYRKKGIAQLLINAAKRYGKQIKAKGLGLSTAADNKQAQSVYERNGFEKDNEFYHYFVGLKN